MTAMTHRRAQAPGDIELLLPWYATGRLDPRDIRRVEQALAGDPGLVQQEALVREEYAATIDLNEILGAPSPRALQMLFEAIDHEPVRQRSVPAHILGRIAGCIAAPRRRLKKPAHRLNVPRP